MFFVHFGLPNKFFSLKNSKLFFKIENKRKKKNSYQTYPKSSKKISYKIDLEEPLLAACNVDEIKNVKI